MCMLCACFCASCGVRVLSQHKRMYMYGPKSTDCFSVNIDINEIVLASYVAGILIDLW